MYRPSEDDLRRFYERSPVGFYRSTADGRFLFANQATATILGYDSPEELTNLVMSRDIYETPAEREALVTHYREKGLVDGVSARWKRKDGAIITVRIFGYVVNDGTGAIFDATLVDETELTAASAALRTKASELESSTVKLRMFLRQMPALIWSVDRDLRVVSSEGAIRSILGFEPGKHQGKTLYEFFGNSAEAELPIARHLDALAGQTVTYEYEYEGKVFVTTLAPERDATGEISGVLATAFDVTAARRWEKRLEMTQRAESLGVLAGGLAHDFNNLLVAILGNADIGLRELPASAAARNALVNVRDAALRAAELTTQLLAYAGRGNIGTTEVALAPVVEELLRILQPSIPPTIQVSANLDQAPTLRADAAALRQVLLNLVSNARDAIGAHPGTIAISTRVEEAMLEPDQSEMLAVPGPGVYAVIAVADNGPGMSEDTRRKVFDPFFTTKASGHGLGLASVLGIVRSHGGGIRLTSQLGKGTTFEILWPIKNKHSSTKIVLDAAVPTTASVLVVDDDEMVRDVLARMFADMGCSTVCVAGGEAGLSALDKYEFDLAMIDLTMPGLAGAPLVAELRRKAPRMAIVVCSGYDRDAKGDLKVDGHLTKPFRFSDLEGVLLTTLARQRR